MIKLIASKLPAKPYDKSNANLSLGFCTFLNPWSYLLMRKNQGILQHFDTLFFDGIILVKLFALIGIKTQRASFDSTSLSPILFKKWSKNNSKIAIIGSDDQNLNQAIDTFKKHFPDLNIGYIRNGFFKSENEKTETIKHIIHNIKPDAIIVGMGTPLQEKFLIQLKELGFDKEAFTCGGYLHQTQDQIDYYPKLINKLNLRAFYRMWDEPKLIKRYFLGYPLFLGYFCIDLIKYKLKKI